MVDELYLEQLQGGEEAVMDAWADVKTQLWAVLEAATQTQDIGRLDRWLQALDQAKGSLTRLPHGEDHLEVARHLLLLGQIAAVDPGSHAARKTLSECFKKLFGSRASKVGSFGHAAAALRSQDWPLLIRQELRSREWGAFGPEWGWAVIRDLWSHVDGHRPQKVLRKRRVAAAGYTKGEAPGFLATLELEILAEGDGDVFHDPRNAFETIPNQKFWQSIAAAWRWACDCVRDLTTVPGDLFDDQRALRVDGRYRVLDGWHPRDAAPFLAEANDESSSGAAARGWWFGLSGKTPDDELVVLAAVLGEGPGQWALGRVDGVEEKIKAAVRDGRFDTVVLTADNEADVAEALARPDPTLGVITRDPPDRTPPGLIILRFGR